VVRGKIRGHAGGPKPTGGEEEEEEEEEEEGERNRGERAAQRFPGQVEKCDQPITADTDLVPVNGGGYMDCNWLINREGKP
jgi:hypothetical protein